MIFNIYGVKFENLENECNFVECWKRMLLKKDKNQLLIIH